VSASRQRRCILSLLLLYFWYVSCTAGNPQVLRDLESWASSPVSNNARIKEKRNEELNCCWCAEEPTLDVSEATSICTQHYQVLEDTQESPPYPSPAHTNSVSNRKPKAPHHDRQRSQKGWQNTRGLSSNRNQQLASSLLERTPDVGCSLLTGLFQTRLSSFCFITVRFKCRPEKYLWFTTKKTSVSEFPVTKTSFLKPWVRRSSIWDLRLSGT